MTTADDIAQSVILGGIIVCYEESSTSGDSERVWLINIDRRFIE